MGIVHLLRYVEQRLFLTPPAPLLQISNLEFFTLTCYSTLSYWEGGKGEGVKKVVFSVSKFSNDPLNVLDPLNQIYSIYISISLKVVRISITKPPEWFHT